MTSQPPHDLRDERADMDEAAQRAPGRCLERALRRAEAAHINRIHAGLNDDALRLPRGAA